MEVNWLKKIHSKGLHNAFTDLCAFSGKLYCCFRTASNHISGDGQIVISTLDAKGYVLEQHTLSLPNVDLRDPKLTVTPDNKLLLIAYARHRAADNSTIKARSISWFSGDGLSWSSARYFGAPSWWVWRIAWQQDQAYGFAYNRAANAINLYKGNPRRTFDVLQYSALSLSKHGKAYPNESALIFDSSDGCAYAIVRRDADTFSAQLGYAMRPYKAWRWIDLGRYIGGPVMLLLKNKKALISGRIVDNEALKTAVLEIDLLTGRLKTLCILPSSGDNSYPGMAVLNEQLYLSYYSCHQDNKSQIYLAKLDYSQL